MVKYCERLFGGRRHVTGLLEPSLAWTEFVPAEARALWRKMADRCAASRGAEFGVRAAEGMVDAIYSVASWLREEHLIPANAARPPAQWRKSLKVFTPEQRRAVDDALGGYLANYEAVWAPLARFSAADSGASAS
jgi:hypothetical protein